MIPSLTEHRTISLWSTGNLVFCK